MSPGMYEFVVVMAVMLFGGAIVCFLGALIEWWWLNYFQ